MSGAVDFATTIAARVVGGQSSALNEVRTSLARIDATEPRINAFTARLDARAIAAAEALDQRIEARDPEALALPLAGVPFAVKNLFDVEGLTTLAGSIIERDKPKAARSCPLVQKLEAAGAILVGALNMDEYAYGFTTENSHYGPARNPHDPSRVAGGSSGGSAASVGAGQVAFSLGSDTNGSIRVPAALCGIFGLKPTYGRLPRTGSFPFSASFDHLGPMSRSVLDLALIYDLLQGADPSDPACAQRPVEPTFATIEQGLDGLRVATLGGYFVDNAQAPANAATALVAQALGSSRIVTLPEVDRARAAAFLITNAEGAALHFDDLKRRAQDFEPLSRDRFLAGTLLPAGWVVRAQRVRRWFAERAAELFESVDVLIAPATPCVAPTIGTEWFDVGDRRLPARASLGLLTQPFSCIGLPVCTVPLHGLDPAAPQMPLGVQLVAAPWREDLLLRAARVLERNGVVSAPAGNA